MQITQHLLQAQKNTKSKESDFYGQIFPIWSKQINTSRTEGDKAAHQLTALFSQIVLKLEMMLKESRMGLQSGQGHEKGLIDAVTSSQTDIRTAFKELKAALEVVNDSKDMLLAEVTMYSANMKEMAVESHHIAFQSQIISLNAKIEAACAGEAGRAFAAVVSEMGELARQSTETSKNIAQKAESIDEAMAKFYSNDKEMEAKEAAQVSSAENIFNDIVERFNQVTISLEKSIHSMETESSQIRDDISNALVELQFQDRVSQIMAHVADDIIALQKHTKTEAHHLDADIWLNEMKAHFSVDQEHGSLGGKKSKTHSNPLTFF